MYGDTEVRTPRAACSAPAPLASRGALQQATLNGPHWCGLHRALFKRRPAPGGVLVTPVNPEPLRCLPLPPACAKGCRRTAAVREPRAAGARPHQHGRAPGASCRGGSCKPAAYCNSAACGSSAQWPHLQPAQQACQKLDQCPNGASTPHFSITPLHMAPPPTQDYLYLHREHNDWVTQLQFIPEIGLVTSSLDTTVKASGSPCPPRHGAAGWASLGCCRGARTSVAHADPYTHSRGEGLATGCACSTHTARAACLPALRLFCRYGTSRVSASPMSATTTPRVSTALFGARRTPSLPPAAWSAT